MLLHPIASLATHHTPVVRPARECVGDCISTHRVHAISSEGRAHHQLLVPLTQSLADLTIFQLLRYQLEAASSSSSGRNYGFDTRRSSETKVQLSLTSSRTLHFLGWQLGVWLGVSLG